MSTSRREIAELIDPDKANRRRRLAQLLLWAITVLLVTFVLATDAGEPAHYDTNPTTEETTAP